MNTLVEAAIARSRTTLSILAMLLLAGWYSASVIPVESDPPVAVPVFVVTIPHEGISPEDAQRLLVMPMELELQDVEGLEELTALASEGVATLVVEFDAEEDLDAARLEVREAIDRGKAKIPSTAEEPIISEITAADFPVVTVNFAGEQVPERTLYTLASALKDRLEGIPEVLEANLMGDREEVLEVVIEPARLEALGVPLDAVVNNILLNNRLIPAGAIDAGAGRFSVKVPSIIEDARDLYDLPVLASGESVITLSDVADIRRTFKDRTRFARVNGVPAISIEVKKRADANLIDTVAKVRAIVDELSATKPREVKVFYTLDQSPWAANQVRELTGNIFTAMALVLVIVVGALGFRSGVLVGLGIPVSFLIALIGLNLIGFSYNFMVMFGMLLGLGMLIDGAIVVTEYADRKMAEGFDKRRAFTLAAKRMFWPVTASVATTLAAFLPLIFWPGVSGKFMRYLPITVFFVLSASLMYALFFGPTLGALFGRKTGHDKATLDDLKVLEDGDPTTLDGFTGVYARVLKRVCHWPLTTFVLTLSVLIGTFMAYGSFGKGMTFFTDIEPTFAIANVRARGNLSVSEANELVREVEDIVLQIEGVKSTFTTVSPANSASFRGGGADRIGRVFMEIHEQEDRRMTGWEVLETVRERAALLAGITVEVEEMEQGPPVGKEIQLQLSSRWPDLLEPATKVIHDHLAADSQLRDLEDTRSLPGITWELAVDRARAAQFNANVTSVGQMVQFVTNGLKVAEYRPNDAEEEVDIRIRFADGSRGISALDTLRVNTPQGAVPVSTFVQRKPVPNVDTIQRIDGINVEFVRANPVPGVLASTKVKELEEWLASQQFDPRVAISFRGANEEQQAAMEFVSMAFVLSLILMFTLLVTQFNSFYQAGLILFAVVMSTAGVLLGLIITQEPFSAILTGVGIVALAGIVVNNNIVLIDTFNHLRKEHPEQPLIDQIVRTGAQRLRPVFLTTVTTIFGLLPLANHMSVDIINRDIIIGGQVSAFWVPLARSIVFGLTTATVLTLIATPAMLAIPQRLQQLFARVVTPSEPPEAEVEPA